MNAIFAAILVGQLFPVSSSNLFPTAYQPPACDCRLGGECQCDKCDCQPAYTPVVIGTVDGAIANYGEAHRLALAEHRPLVVCVVDGVANVRPVVDDNPAAVVCIATPDEGFPSEGVYYFAFADGRLIQSAGPSLTKSREVKGGRIECGPNGCRFVPSAGRYSFGGCASCGR